LTDALQRATGQAGMRINTIELTKEFGETRILGQRPLDEPSWHWPKR
jgi:hypothetical protein